MTLIALACFVLLPWRAMGATCGFAAAAKYTAANRPTMVVVADVNHDGTDDLAVLNNTSGDVSILLGNGFGIFAAPINYTVVGNPTSLAIGDLNGDRHVDLLIAKPSSNTVSVLLGSGTGSFGAAADYTVLAPMSAGIGDINGDGKPDLLAVGADAVSVWFGDGTGSFAAPVSFTIRAGSSSIAIGDLNIDGHADLAVTNHSSSSIEVLLSAGNGTLSPAVSYPVGGVQYSVAIGDVNDDGNPDLAVANYSLSSVSILLGQGQGTFATVTQHALGARPIAVTVGDITTDGKPDVVTANPASNTVSILPGAASGTLGTPITCVLDSTAVSVALGDVNGDGKVDSVVANGFYNTVSVLLNTSPAWTFTFTDEPLTTLTPVKAAHFTELRSAIDGLRARHQIVPFVYTDAPLTPGATQVTASHLVQTRSALDAVYDALAYARPVYTDPMPNVGVTTIKRRHVEQIRSSVRSAATFILTASRVGGGSGTVTSAPAGLSCGVVCAKHYPPGTAVTLTATPAPGFIFAAWSGACTGNGTCQVSMSSDTAVTAAFTVPQVFTLTVTRFGTGTGAVTSNPAGIICGVDCAEAYTVGTTVTLTPSAPAGSYFIGWSGGCSGNGECVVPMMSNTAVGASFGPMAAIDVQPRSIDMGTVRPCDGGIVGAHFTVNAPANVNWTVSWSGSDLPPQAELSPTSGAGPGSVLFLITVPAQTPSFPFTCADYINFAYGDSFFFTFYNASGQVTGQVLTTVTWTFPFLP